MTATVELVFRSDTFLRDGRYAANAWLQELRRPFSGIVWENALWISPATAERRGLEEGDVVRLEVGGVAAEAPVTIIAGTAEDCVLAELTVPGVQRLRPSDGAWSVMAMLSATGRRHELVKTQHHFSMEGRAPVRWHSPSDRTALPAEPDLSETLFPAPHADGRVAGKPLHRWAMVIDLARCTGCSACVVACQAENNTPSVGRDQCARGREMHWLRVDRYFNEDGQRSAPQPVPCMHCETAPCELVCPVGATVHSTEGLNEMVYNRCVGTRYCSNNCPYKVRRFNFLDFRAPADSPLHLQENPEVTVRERGVMEKCTYCVQRIEAGRITAEREGRPLRDGEIQTACQQVCPAQAIVFGDLADTGSAVSRLRSEPGNYGLLAELNTRPRTTYLPRLHHPPA